MCFRLGSAVGPSAFVRQPLLVSLRPSAFACQPSRPLFPPASPWPSAMVGGVWMVWPWLRSAFGTASGCFGMRALPLLVLVGWDSWSLAWR